MAICVRNSSVPSEFPAQRPVTRSIDVSLICIWINGWVNNCEAGDLRRYRAHYDVTVIVLKLIRGVPVFRVIQKYISKTPTHYCDITSCVAGNSPATRIYTDMRITIKIIYRVISLTRFSRHTTHITAISAIGYFSATVIAKNTTNICIIRPCDYNV